MSRESTRKHRDYLNAKFAKERPDDFAKCGPEFLEIELDQIEFDFDGLLENDEFDRREADGTLPEWFAFERPKK